MPCSLAWDGLVEEEDRPADDRHGHDDADEEADLLAHRRGAHDVAGLEVLRRGARVGRGDADDGADAGARSAWWASPVQSSATKTRHVPISVAMVIPEIGFDELPMMPTIRLETVTKKKPNTTTRRPVRSDPGKEPGSVGRSAMISHEDDAARRRRSRAADRARSASWTPRPRRPRAGRGRSRGSSRRWSGRDLMSVITPRARDGARADVADVRPVDLLRDGVCEDPARRSKPRACRSATRCASGHEERDERDEDQPREHAAREHLRGDARADDVADAEVLRRDLAVEDGVRVDRRGARAEGGHVLPEPEDAHEELVGDGGVDAGEDALGEAAALLADDEHLGARRPLGVRKVAVLLDDEAPPQRDHHEDAEHAAHGARGSGSSGS